MKFLTGIRLCHKHCGCISRKRRSFESLMIENNESDDIQTIENLNFAMIEVFIDVEMLQKSFEDDSNQLTTSENASRLRRSADSENLNRLYSSFSERINQIDELLEGKNSKR